MKKTLKTIALSLGLSVCGVGILCVNADQGQSRALAQYFTLDNKPKKEKVAAPKPSAQVQVQHTWEVPAILTEVSGIAYLGSDRFACVQDEEGKIFVYNTAESRIEQEIPFAGPGDYEGIALAGSTAYVVRSDGHLFEVAHYASGKPQVQEYATSLTAKNNVEGLGYDAPHHRLLLAIKGAEASGAPYKGIYAFDLKTKKMDPKPVVKLALDHPILQEAKAKKLEKVLQPSEVAVHPLTGEIYVTEAVNPKILVLDAQGNPQRLYWLDKGTFAQPEGIAFSPSGELFISNEGKSAKANILQVHLTHQ